jgi:hypothetical protein
MSNVNPHFGQCASFFACVFILGYTFQDDKHSKPLKLFEGKRALWKVLTATNFI